MPRLIRCHFNFVVGLHTGIVVSAKALRKTKKALAKKEAELADCQSKLAAEETKVRAGPMNCGAPLHARINFPPLFPSKVQRSCILRTCAEARAAALLCIC